MLQVRVLATDHFTVGGSISLYMSHISTPTNHVQENYPQVALLKQVKGVGTLIALTFLLTLEGAHRFRKSRDVGC